MKKSTIILLLSAITAYLAYRLFSKSKTPASKTNRISDVNSELAPIETTTEDFTLRMGYAEGTKAEKIAFPLTIITTQGQIHDLPKDTIRVFRGEFTEFHLPDGQFLRYSNISFKYL